MINENAIIIEGLSKKYRIGKKVDTTLRGTLKNMFSKNKGVDFWALEGVSFSVKKGEAVGVIGRNGAGKSTLLKLLSKITYPTKGRAILDGRVTSLLEVGTGFHPELTGRENIYLNGSLLGMTRHEINLKLDEIIDFSGVSKFIDTPVKRYSSGMYVRLAFSVAAHLNTEILILDEVLAVGDSVFQKLCLEKMNEVVTQGKTVLLVSHDSNLIKALTTRAVLLKNGRVDAVGQSESIYNFYQEESGIVSTASFRNSPLKTITASYVEKLTIELDFDISTSMKIPHICLAISNSYGEILFANNPAVEKLEIPYHFRKGKCNIQLDHPVIRHGKYFISIWIADGSEDVFNAKECISFTVSNESKDRTGLGYIIPKFTIMDEKL